VKTLLLWDIDGTLIDSGGAGERALRTALRLEFGIEDSLGWLDYFGRTDSWIARDILEHHGFQPTPQNIRRFLEAYLTAVTVGMANPHARVLPGVKAILDAAVSSGDIAQGLLTGNLERGAKVKLSHLGLSSYFPFGAYADDSELRNELGPHAVRRAMAHHGVSFPARRVFIIGDTPHDIACGKIIGARTIAVATGRYTADQLRAHAPDALFDTLGDAAAFFACLAENP
jgi:phosphoglycolate phosphatase